MTVTPERTLGPMGTAAKEGGVTLGGRGTFRRCGQENFIFTPRWNRLRITETMLKKNIFGRHTKIKSSDLTCALYAARINWYKKKGKNLSCKISARWMCPGTAPGAL
jgi:hypothetical protein